MSEENIDHADLHEVSNDAEGKKGTFPIRTLNATIPFIGNVYQKYGASGFHTLEIIGDANNLSVNSIKSFVSTAQQYSCLKKSHGEGYKITSEFTTIHHPVNSEERHLTAIECIKNVPFYKQLFIDYEGQVVPSLDGLINVFVRKLSMKANRAKIAAEVFLANLRDYDLINNRNVLILKQKINQPEPPRKDPGFDAATKNNHSDTPQDDGKEDTIKIPIRLKGRRMAYLSFPDDCNDQDLQKIFKVIKAYIEIYKDEEKEEESEDLDFLK